MPAPRLHSTWQESRLPARPNLAGSRPGTPRQPQHSRARRVHDSEHFPSLPPFEYPVCFSLGLSRMKVKIDGPLLGKGPKWSVLSL